LSDINCRKNHGVVVGPGDDAGVFRYKNTFLVETVDVITPIVDDPYTFGAICAANSVSDVYAMGGTPLTALAVLGFASCDFGAPVIRQLLKGAVNKLEEAGACLIGGHSIEDQEFKLGFAVTGVVKKDKILRAAGASAGEVLVLTKKLGTGIITSAVKKKKIDGSYLNKVIDSMLLLNKAASKAAVSAGSRGATDVTGFGLLGHALNIARSSGADLVIRNENVPLMDRVRELSSEGAVPKGAKSNLGFCSRNTSFSGSIPEGDRLALADPQTSGGLLISLPPKGLKKFDRIMNKEKMPYWIIGEVVKGSGNLIVE
ncbi:MAG: selenide, water dikinase SelD, partial [Nitrospirota bacterium]|nr:selenide, water dikinase SelD [Nitrospirota bacterium]